MSTKFCDHLAYGPYAAIPTWGAAQDGDGTAIGVGTPSTAAIVFTAAPTAGSIAVLGVTFSAITWGATATTAADALAAAINNATGTQGAATAIGPASFTTKSQVRNHLYARGPSTGAPAGTCQVMTRQASASHAGLICFTHTLNNVSSTPTVTFAGGSGGCWGWLVNGSDLTIWPSAVAKCAYGLWGSIAQFCGTTDPGDKVVVRAKTVAVNLNGNFAPLSFHNMGSSSNPVRFVVDDGSAWPEDGSEPVLWLRTTSGFGQTIFNGWNSAGYQAIFVSIEGQLYPSGVRSLLFSHNFSGASSTIWTQSHVTFVEAEFWPEVAGGSYAFSSGYQTQTQANTTGPRLVGGKLYATTNATALFNLAQYANIKLSLDNTVIQLYSGITTPHPGLFDGATAYSLAMTMRGCKFAGFVSGSKLFRVTAVPPPISTLSMQDCDLGGITDVGANLSSLATNYAPYKSMTRYVSMTSSRASRDFYHETQNGLVRWTAQRYPPYCNATLLDTATGWALEVTPATVASQIAINEPLKTPALAKLNSLPSGARTFTAQIAVDTRLPWTTGDVALIVQYVDTNGNSRRLSSHNLDRNALTASDATWSAETGGLVTFGANGSTLNKYTIALTTPTGWDLAAGTQVNAHLEFYTEVPDVTHITLVDPEVTIA